MLCQFIVKNFKSYRDETVFDLQAENIDEHFESLLRYEEDNKAFLPVSVIYGPNGGGKSGIIEAFNCLVQRVMQPITFMGKEQIEFPIALMELVKCTPFAFDEISSNEPTEFTVFFRYFGFEFRFTISLYEDEIVAESLHKRKIGGTRSSMIFERDKSGIKLGASMKKNHINTNVNPKMPYLSFLAINYDIETIKSAEQWFSACDFYRLSQLISKSYPGSILEKFIDDNMVGFNKKNFLKIINEIDITIDDYNIERKGDKKSEGLSEDEIYTIRIKDGQKYMLKLREESQGTRKLFHLLPIALLALKGGGIITIDEMDASLHPKLLRYIVKLFKNKSINKNKAQLLFTSHDVTTMKGDLFRRDEIWFAAKDDDGASGIYSLYEIRDTDGSRVRANASFDKQYMRGRYGADPYLSNVLGEEWGKNNEQ